MSIAILAEMVAEKNIGWGNVVSDEGWRKGPWTAEEDRLLIEYVKFHGEGKWNSVSTLAGLKRNGKSCRLRWVNYLRPDLKRGQITPHEEKIIQELHARWGNRWSTIAKSLPGRTDNEIKNYWRTHFLKKPNRSSANSMRVRQQFKHQQQQLQKNIPMDVNKIISLFDENNETISAPATLIQNSLDDDEEQGIFCSMFSSYASVPEASSDDDIVWDGLWNLNDL